MMRMPLWCVPRGAGVSKLSVQLTCRSECGTLRRIYGTMLAGITANTVVRLVCTVATSWAICSWASMLVGQVVASAHTADRLALCLFSGAQMMAVANDLTVGANIGFARRFEFP